MFWKDIWPAANHTIEKVEDFWMHAKIPIKHRQVSIRKLEQLFCQWKGLKKNQRRQTETQQAIKAKFLEMVEEFFVIALVSAMKLIENEVANCEVLWNSRSSESNDEDVCVSTTSWFVFDRDVEDVSHALWLQFFNRFLPLTVSKWDTYTW